MRIFLSAEIYGAADHLLVDLRREFSKKLSLLDNKNYGDELVEIAIISMILPDYYYNEVKERKLFKRKTSEADIRLKIDYEQFIRAKPDKRRQIYYDHIIQSLETLRNKVSANYQFDTLMKDVKEVLKTDGSLS